MPAKMRNLTMADVSAVMAAGREHADAQHIYKLVESIAAETCGFVLLTTLKFVEADIKDALRQKKLK